MFMFTQDHHLASRLLQYLMEQAHHDNRSVFRNNLEIIKTLVECWKDNLQAPTKLVNNHKLPNTMLLVRFLITDSSVN